ncbi:RHS repeat domain-containing protein [Lysobacter arvi]|uniref:RHS repeat protein n=1 Tax=Lysobacter arvi TaxID=3038776 RepID=A0ABU1CF44_9GAMM|nr:RHS repeat domain-containing protein [Lysobacter arvi]MDR0183579.1 RHS repeat protein [Lysobacter arvi]
MKQVCIAFLAASLLLASHANAGSIAYTYDSLGRVIRVVYTVGATTTTITYAYDAAGNRTSTVTTSP